MKILYISLLFLMNCVLSVAQPEIIIPKPHQLKWHEAEMGAVFHYDLHVFDGIRYGQGNNRISPQRSCVPTLCVCGTTFTRSPSASRSATMAFLAS